MNALPIAYDLSVLSAQQRERHDALAEQLLTKPEAVHELHDGYAIRLPVSALVAAAEFVSLERLCCPFLTFRLQLKPGTDVVWLEMSGSEDIKALLLAEFGFQGADSDRL